MPTYIAGKDAPLEESIALFRSRAQELDLKIIEHPFVHPLPDIYSINIESSVSPFVYSNGKGTSKLAALASAYGELFERLYTHMFFSDYYLGPKIGKEPFVHYEDEKWTDPNLPKKDLFKEILNASLKKFYLTDNELSLEVLIDKQGAVNGRGICSLPFTEAFSKKTVFFPVNLIDNLYASNGMSAGNTKEEAAVQALSEIIERYTKSTIIKSAYALPEVPKDYIAKFPKLLHTLDLLNAGSFKAVCYDASLGGKFPVVCVVLFNEKNGTCFAAFGSHPLFEVALDRTLSELLQGRNLNDCDDFAEPSLEPEIYADPTNLESHFIDSTGILPLEMFKAKSDFAFSPVNFAGTTSLQYEFLKELIKKEGFKIYERFYTAANLPVCRIIIPGMSEVYPIDDLAYNNCAAGFSLINEILELNAKAPCEGEIAALLCKIEDADFSDEAPVFESLGIIADDIPALKNLRFGQLKCLLYLAVKDYDNALFYAKWTLNFNAAIFDEADLNFYRCLEKMLECIDDPLLFKDLHRCFCLLYGEETVQKVLSHIKGNDHFYGLPKNALTLYSFKAHEKLIKIYEKIKE